MPVAFKSAASLAMQGDFVFPPPRSGKTSYPPAGSRVDPPSLAFKRLPGVAGSPPQDACAPGGSICRLNGGDGTRFRASDRTKDHAKSTRFERDEILCVRKPFLLAAVHKNSPTKLTTCPLAVTPSYFRIIPVPLSSSGVDPDVWRIPCSSRPKAHPIPQP
jgi:hypothetical protein